MNGRTVIRSTVGTLLGSRAADIIVLLFFNSGETRRCVTCSLP